MGKTQTSSNRKSPKAVRVSTYLKYAGLTTQLFFTIGIGGWLGYELDNYLDLKFPVFMLVFGLMAFAGMMVQLYRSIK